MTERWRDREKLSVSLSFSPSVGSLRQHGLFHIQELARSIDQAIDREWLLQEIVGARGSQIGDLILLDHAANANDLHLLERVVRANTLANFLAVDIGQHNVEHDQIGPKLLHEHAGVEAVVRRLDLKAAVASERVAHQLNQFLIVIDDQQLPLAALEGIGRNAVVPHKRVQLVPRNAAESAARNAEPL